MTYQQLNDHWGAVIHARSLAYFHELLSSKGQKRYPTPYIHAHAGMTSPNMQLQLTIQDGQVWIADGTETLHLELQRLKS